MQNFFNWITANQQIIYIVILMIFVGIEVIGRVPSVLHTPLMSGANAIHGVVIIGAIIVMGKAESSGIQASDDCRISIKMGMHRGRATAAS